ncbi:spore germination protein [Paenibacillus curdlanolyticus YK9]|uniref:Spore germination protein n=1 Tax=Paenibacillus curdlanolyticus YK9 TaxID=717606 RepID=E0I612_9BACL|nr:endospore germination permease [Paenibacillus curdlanolyticus]EFM12404.1 spore germination protein [Paenibacillus curdlanolyticus YK9]
METATISYRQFQLLVLFTTVSTAYFLLPPALIGNAKQYGWFIPLWTGVVGIGSSLLWVYLTVKFPKQNLVQIARSILGPIAGSIVGMLLIFQSVLICAWVINNLDDFMSITLLTNTNELVFGSCFLVITVYATIKGIESIARTTEFFMPLLLISFIIFFILSIKTWSWSRFAPVLPIDWHGMFYKSSLLIAFPYMDAFTLFMLFPFVEQRPVSAYLKGSFVAAFILAFITFIVIGVLGVTRASHITYPLFKMAQELEISPFLEHLEALISIGWLTFVFIKLALNFYCAVLGLSHLFSIQDRGKTAIPLAVIVSALSLHMHGNIIENHEWISHYTLFNNSIYGVLIPLLLVAAYLLLPRSRV